MLVKHPATPTMPDFYPSSRPLPLDLLDPTDGRVPQDQADGLRRLFAGRRWSRGRRCHSLQLLRLHREQHHLRPPGRSRIEADLQIGALLRQPLG